MVFVNLRKIGIINLLTLCLTSIFDSDEHTIYYLCTKGVENM